MTPKRFCLFSVATFIILMMGAPDIGQAAAITYEVNPSDSSCLPSSNPPCYTTIQAAIDAAVISAQTNTQNSYSVMVEPGPYSGGIILKSGIPVRGRETARTFLSGGGSGTIATASGVTGISISNFTIINASTGVLVSNSSSISILNNVFRTGTGGTAVQVQNSTTTSIINNTFHQNGTAISRDADITIKNNIFSTNSVTISSPSMPSTLITFNCFFANITDGPTGSNAVTALDPLFVSTSALDFHLKQGSPNPCIDAGDSNVQYNDSFNGTRNDIGAYGGPASDTIPFQVPQPSASIASSSSISVSWSANNSYMVTNTVNQGSYNIYYSLNTSGTVTSVNVASPATSTVISGLTPTISTPSTPAITSTSPRNNALVINWTQSSGATGYNLHWGITSPSDNTTNVGNTTSYTLTGLVNGQVYQLAVSAYAVPTYYVSVTARDNIGPTYDPGVQHESAYSTEAVVFFDTLIAESLVSTPTVTDFPEAITPYPALPNSGCFIATAAYGYYAAPQVQALREFRDRYLLTNSFGRAFVAWYYRYGPIGAAYINEHPWLKPVVRTALLPAVGGAMFMTQTSLFAKILVLAVMSVVVLFTLRRRIYGGGR